MRPLATLALAVLLTGCVSGPPLHNWRRQTDPRVADHPRALYHLAKSRDERDRANELDELAREQQQRLVEIKNRKQETAVEASRTGYFKQGPRNVIEVEVRTLEGESLGLTQQVDNQKTVVSLIEGRISQCDRRSREHLLEMDSALRNPRTFAEPGVGD